MPEGHTIHRLARDHTELFRGQKLRISSPQGRFEGDARRITGCKLVHVDAHGKHLFYHFQAPRSRKANCIHVHLGLYGKFRVHPLPAPEPRGAVRMRWVGQSRALDLNGPTCCEIISEAEVEALRDRLGQDPLRDDADPERVWNRVRNSKAAIGTLLLNQAVVAGVGNVYRAELLFLTGVHPDRPGNSLSRDQFDQLWELTVQLLQTGVKYNRIITVSRETAGKPLSRLNAEERLWCYKQPQCKCCGSSIRKWTLASRTMYACNRCQA